MSIREMFPAVVAYEEQREGLEKDIENYKQDEMAALAGNSAKELISLAVATQGGPRSDWTKAGAIEAIATRRANGKSSRPAESLRILQRLATDECLTLNSLVFEAQSAAAQLGRALRNVAAIVGRYQSALAEGYVANEDSSTDADRVVKNAAILATYNQVFYTVAQGNVHLVALLTERVAAASQGRSSHGIYPSDVAKAMAAEESKSEVSA